MRAAYDGVPGRAVERLEPVVAEEHHAAALGVRPGAPLMLVERVAYDGDGTPVEFARDHHRGDRARLVVRAPTSGTGAGCPPRTSVGAAGLVEQPLEPGIV